MPVATAYVSRPSIQIDGQLQTALAATVLSLFVEETTEGLARCEVRLSNYGPRARGADYFYFGRDLLDFSKELAIELGPPDDTSSIFVGQISALEADYPQGGGAELVVLAEDRLQALRMTRRTRTFEEVSDADILDQIAAEHNLTTDLSLEGPTYRLVAQVNQSDLAFIRERARVVGAEVWVAGSTLFARSRTARAGEPVELAYGANLLSFQVRADLAHQCTEVSVTGWDVAAKAGIDETGGEGSIANELNGDTSGSSVLADAFSERTERLVHAVPLTSDQARSVAEAHYRARARRFLTGNGLCDGNGRVRVGTTVTLSGLGSLFDGDYAVVRTRHTYDLASGFRSEFDVERPGLGPAAA